MSDTPAVRRIRVQPNSRDPATLRFLLDTSVQGGLSARYSEAVEQAPLSVALFAIPGVERVEVEGASIHVRRSAGARWDDLKAPIAAAIRAVLDETDAPLGTDAHTIDPASDAGLLTAVREILDRTTNPAIASHGGHIAAERVVDGIVFLRMSGGCQGCASSRLTLRGGVERTLRSALPGIREIVDVTDHAAGQNPFHTAPGGESPAVTALRAAVAAQRTEKQGGPDGDRPANSRAKQAGSKQDGPSLEARVRAHLEALPVPGKPISYGALSRALGLWRAGSVRRVTQALEEIMREDARDGRPFIAARAVSRANGQPGKGFFDLARALGRGPRPGETEAAYHARELGAIGAEAAAAPGDPGQGARQPVE